MFGFLFLCYGLMIMTSAMTTVLLVYFLLCAEDYRWQWRSFIGAGMTGGYVFLYALIFWAMRVSFGGLTGAVLYLGYSALLAFLAFILTGEWLPLQLVWTASNCFLNSFRFDRVLRQLVVYPTYLQVHQGGLMTALCVCV